MTPEINDIVLRSFFVSGSATLITCLVAVPCSVLLCLRDFRGKKPLVAIVHSMLSVPAVVIGLCIYLLYARTGPLGALDLLYTPLAMISAQAILAFPIALALAHSGLQAMAKPVRDTALTLGASTGRMILTVLWEGRRTVMTATIMAFSRVIGETGMTMMEGGNIKGYTRVMTTTIALETMKGNFELAVRLGVILFGLAILLNLILHFVIRESHAPAL